MDRRCIPVLLIAGLAVSLAPASQSEAEYAATLVTGFETNPLRVSDDGPNGLFTQLQLDGAYRRLTRPTLLFFTDASARGRFFESTVSNADFGAADARAGVVYSPARFEGNRLRFTAGASLSLYRSTFVDRETGDVYTVDANPPTDPATSVKIEDRLDFDSTALFFDTHWKQNPRTRLFLKTRLEDADYVKDYTNGTDLDSLDYRSLSVEPGIDLQLPGTVRMVLSVALTDLDYDDRSALDVAGDPVADSDRSYRYARYRLAFLVTPRDKWKVHFGLVETDREDTYAGYYDYGSTSSYVGFDRELARDSRVRLYVSMLDLAYDAATVTGNPGDDNRGNEVRRLLGRYERGFHDRFQWFVESGVQRTDSRDPIFAYDRDWLLTGVQYRR